MAHMKARFMQTTHQPHPHASPFFFVGENSVCWLVREGTCCTVCVHCKLTGQGIWDVRPAIDVDLHQLLPGQGVVELQRLAVVQHLDPLGDDVQPLLNVHLLLAVNLKTDTQANIWGQQASTPDVMYNQSRSGQLNPIAKNPDTSRRVRNTMTTFQQIHQQQHCMVLSWCNPVLGHTIPR